MDIFDIECATLSGYNADVRCCSMAKQSSFVLVSCMMGSITFSLLLRVSYATLIALNLSIFPPLSGCSFVIKVLKALRICSQDAVRKRYFGQDSRIKLYGSGP